MRMHTYPFLRKYVKRIDLHGNYKALKERHFDAIVVGSNQIWHTMYVNPIVNS